MTPPDDTDTAEIYVEVRVKAEDRFVLVTFQAKDQPSLSQGKRKMVDGFIRWCRRGNAGLNQLTTVKEIIEESPTGLYDGFYVKTH